jgi:tRNA(Ile)-lysidine synthase
VLAALSGGSDSVALVYILRALDAAGDLRLVGLAHFNHQLRAAADDDERFCAGMAASLNLSLVVDRDDVGALARRQRRSIEDAARSARHAFLERARRDCQADAIAVGHTKDDQAETFLLRLLRGAGARGLASMHPRRGSVIRPLLDCRRAELKAYLDAAATPFIHDETNDDVDIPRNRVRAELLPVLEQRFNPSVVDVLADEADLAREEWHFLNQVVDDWWPRVVRRAGDQSREWVIDGMTLAGLPRAIARLIVRRAMAEASGGRPVGFADVERALELMHEGGGALDVPGHTLQRVGEDLVLTGRLAGHVGRPQAPVANLFRYPLSIPGEIEVAAAGFVISVEAAGSAPAGGVIPGNGVVAVVRRDSCSGSLAVRNRRPGDKFRPVGVGGRKKLQDFFVDRKVGRQRRDLIPLVVDAFDRIVWVAGYSIDEEFQVTDPAQAVLILRLKAVGGSA